MGKLRLSERPGLQSSRPRALEPRCGSTSGVCHSGAHGSLGYPLVWTSSDQSRASRAGEKKSRHAEQRSKGREMPRALRPGPCTTGPISGHLSIGFAEDPPPTLCAEGGRGLTAPSHSEAHTEGPLSFPFHRPGHSGPEVSGLPRLTEQYVAVLGFEPRLSASEPMFTHQLCYTVCGHTRTHTCTVSAAPQFQGLLYPSSRPSGSPHWPLTSCVSLGQWCLSAPRGPCPLPPSPGLCCFQELGPAGVPLNRAPSQQSPFCDLAEQGFGGCRDPPPQATQVCPRLAGWGRTPSSVSLRVMYL